MTIAHSILYNISYDPAQAEITCRSLPTVLYKKQKIFANFQFHKQNFRDMYSVKFSYLAILEKLETLSTVDKKTDQNKLQYYWQFGDFFIKKRNSEAHMSYKTGVEHLFDSSIIDFYKKNSKKLEDVCCFSRYSYIN